VLCDLWPTQVYITTLKDIDCDSLKEKINKIKTSIPDSWTVPCNTSLFHNNKLFEYVDFEPLTFSIYNEIVNYCISLNVNLTEFKPVIHEMWLNKYDINTGQELHIHTNYHISGIYVLDADENSSDVVFESPLTDKEMLELPVYDFNNLLKVKTEKNKLIIFRSWLKHGVFTHKATTNRTTIAFNCRLEPVVF